MSPFSTISDLGHLDSCLLLVVPFPSIYLAECYKVSLAFSSLGYALVFILFILVKQVGSMLPVLTFSSVLILYPVYAFVVPSSLTCSLY